jgi:hypothetical protein
LPQTHLKQGRTEMLLAALALAPPEGVAEVDCFQNVYGFPYEPEVHKGVFDVLIHRSREHASALGTIVRGKGLIRLELNGPILIADPRCTRPLGDALLGVLAESAGGQRQRGGQGDRGLVAARASYLARPGQRRCLSAREGRA